MTAMTTLFRRSVLLVALIALTAAACTPSSGALGTPATPPAGTTAPSIAEPSGDLTPAPSASNATASPGGSAVPASASPASASPAPSPGGTIIVRAYFIAAAPGTAGDAKLVPVLRVVPKTVAVATAAMHELLAGPDAALDGRASLGTTVPAGTRLLGISITSGIATVDLSAEFASGGGSASMFARLAQVVFTLTQFPTVKTVLFELDGKPVTAFSGEGILLDHPVGRADYHDQLPAIFVDRPAYGAAIGNPASVSGLANVFEAQFRVRLLDATGGVVIDAPVMATCGTGCWGDFSMTLPYAMASPQWGTLRVYDLSPKDGEPENVVDYPVWLG
jgi:germination protein M